MSYDAIEATRVGFAGHLSTQSRPLILMEGWLVSQHGNSTDVTLTTGVDRLFWIEVVWFGVCAKVHASGNITLILQ